MISTRGRRHWALGPERAMPRPIRATPGSTVANPRRDRTHRCRPLVNMDPNGDQASITISTLSGGTHQLSAVYGGDQTFSGSNTMPDLVTVAPAPTQLTATPAIAHLASTDVYSFSVSATLTRKDTGAPLAGEQIDFSAGSTPLCSAITDGQGLASCNALAGAPAMLTNQAYGATFAGTSEGWSAGLVDVLLGIAVLRPQAPHPGVFSGEGHPLVAEPHPVVLGVMRPQVGQRAALLLGHVVAVGLASVPHRLPPPVTAGLETGGPAQRVPDLVVVLDGVVGLVLGLGAGVEQPRVEHFFLGGGVQLEEVGQRRPAGGQPVARRFPVLVELGEAPAEGLVVIEDEVAHIRHVRELPGYRARETQPG